MSVQNSHLYRELRTHGTFSANVLTNRPPYCYEFRVHPTLSVPTLSPSLLYSVPQAQTASRQDMQYHRRFLRLPFIPQWENFLSLGARASTACQPHGQLTLHLFHRPFTTLPSPSRLLSGKQLPFVIKGNSLSCLSTYKAISK